MKIILGDVEPDGGTILRSRFNSVGYLPQDHVYHTGRSLLEETATAFDDLNRLQKRIEEIGIEIEAMTAHGGSSTPGLDELVKEMGRAQSILEHREGYTVEVKMKQVLTGLGFSETDLSRMTEEFSGGWQMRIALAKLLLREPTILMLDEPTNHLDIESLEWIEEYLKGYHGSLVLVSHDSRFLDNLVGTVIEIARGMATEYSGNYSSYLTQRAERRAIIEASSKNRQRMVDSTNRFIERFRYKSTKARQVQSRIKQLEKMETIEIESDGHSMSLDFPAPPRAGRVVMEIENLSKAYGDHRVLEGVDLTIERTDRIALLGPNGSGKSTLARIIAGIDTFQVGHRTPGHHAILSYYAQNTVEELDPGKTILETLDAASPLKAPGELRTLLGCFLFSGDDAFKPVSVLSGGEKSRLALASMILKPANLLIMDEPTNHLDTQSKAILQSSLERFPGAYLIVSHDRDFLTPLITKVAVLKDNALHLYHGNVDEYLERCHQQELLAAADTLSGTTNAASSQKDRKRKEAESRQERYRQLKPLKASQELLEQEINACERKKGEMESAFSDQKTYQDDAFIRSLQVEYAQTTSRLASLYDTWAAIEEEIDEMTRND